MNSLSRPDSLFAFKVVLLYCTKVVVWTGITMTREFPLCSRCAYGRSVRVENDRLVRCYRQNAICLPS